MRKLLTKQQVKDAIDGVAEPPRVPALYTTWFIPWIFSGKDFFKGLWARARYIDDISVCGWHDYRWHLYHMDPRNGSLLRCVVKGLGAAPPPKKKYLDKDGNKGMDNNNILEDMENVDEFIKRLPDPNKTLLLLPGPGKRYKLAWLFSILFECHWNIRGMDNALMDYYLYPEQTHKLYRAFTDYHKVLIKRCKKELHADGIFMSDDIGTQTGPFFSPDVFREFFFPYYKELIDYAHSLGMHFWFHSCGNIEMFLPMLIEAGLDVIHPIQKFANDQEAIFEKYHDQITFFYGFDLQQVIPLGTPDEVEEEVHRTMDIFCKAKGRLIYTSGNSFSPDCPIESFKRLMKVSHTYNPYIKKHQNEQNQTNN